MKIFWPEFTFGPINLWVMPPLKIGSVAELARKRKRHPGTGTMWITNGKENRKIRNPREIPDGWRFGMVIGQPPKLESRGRL